MSAMRPTGPGSPSPPRCSSRSPICAATAADTARSPNRRPECRRPTSIARRGRRHRRRRCPGRLPRGALHPRRGARGALSRRRRMAGRARLRIHRRLPRCHVRRWSATRPVCSPTPTPARSAATSSPDCGTVSASQGMMIESLNDDLDMPPGAPDKTPARRLATLEAAGELAIPFTTGILCGIGEIRADRIDALEAIAASHRRHGHVQEVIVQNFLPKPGTAMHAAPPCPERRVPLVDRRRPARAPRRRSTSRRRPTSPTTSAACSTPASTTGVASPP